MAPKGDNVVVSSMKLEKLLCMKGGKGEASYANNSQAQAIHARSMLHLLEETLDRVHLNSPEFPFQVADLGCSSGNNTIHIIDVIIKHMIKRFESSGLEPPEFSAFFADLPSNDFNTLFQLLPPPANYGGSMEECLAASGHRNYFAAGVPGSFHRRLFPARSIDVFHSAFSLHWLSQVPECVLDKRSAAYNKGRNFCRPHRPRWGWPPLRDHFQDAWDDLVQEAAAVNRPGLQLNLSGPRVKRLGLITSEKRDNFNIPVYAPSLQDFKEVVEANGSFTIDKLEVFKGGSPLVVNHPDNEAEVSRAMANSCRSVAGVLVDAHIGDGLSEELFLRVEHRAKSHAKELLEKLQFFHIVASLSFA
ncbi:indole-3-acetate O-methyltransferase 1 [Populus alba x Populus x berolinensis]|nr:indole-3-acetate O-methyltransferase 1 [Populus alba x Populus x berolinensis]